MCIGGEKKFSFCFCFRNSNSQFAVENCSLVDSAGEITGSDSCTFLQFLSEGSQQLICQELNRNLKFVQIFKDLIGIWFQFIKSFVVSILAQSKKKECKFNLGGLKKQNRLWHCHANNKTGWHVDSFKPVGVHIILLMYILLMHRPFFCPVFGFSMSGGTKHQKLDWHKRFSIFWNPLFCFSCSSTQKLSSGYLFQIPCCKNRKKVYLIWKK